jgi:hypothetical protein
VGSSVPSINCTLASDENRGNANIHDGSDSFRTEQIGRILDAKVPPFEKCQVTVKDTRVTIRQPGDLIPLGLRVLKEHDLAWMSEGAGSYKLVASVQSRSNHEIRQQCELRHPLGPLRSIIPTVTIG